LASSNWRIFRKLFVIYFIKHYHSKVKFEAKYGSLKVGV